MKDKDGCKVVGPLPGIKQIPAGGRLVVTDGWYVDLEHDDPSNTVEINVTSFE